MLYIDDEQNITLTRGDTGIFNISLQNQNGKAYTPQEGDTLRFALSDGFGKEALVIKDIPIMLIGGEMDKLGTPDDVRWLNDQLAKNGNVIYESGVRKSLTAPHEFVIGYVADPSTPEPPSGQPLPGVLTSCLIALGATGIAARRRKHSRK